MWSKEMALPLTGVILQLRGCTAAGKGGACRAVPVSDASRLAAG